MRRRPGWALAALLLGPLALPARAAAPAPVLASAQSLVPAEQQLFLNIDIARLRQHGPAATVAHLEAVLGPRLAELGLDAPRLRRLVVGGGVDRAVPAARRPLLIVIDQGPPGPGAPPPDLAALRRALGDDSPARPGALRGVPVQRGRRLSAALLPDGTALVSTAALLPSVLDRAAGRLSAAAPAPLLGELGRPEAALLTLLLRLPPSLQRDLRQGGAPAAPRELTLVGRPGEGGGLELRGAARMAGEADAAATATWLTGRLQALRGETPVLLLGLSGLIGAIEVTAEGRQVRLRLPLGRADYAGLLERLGGLGSLLSLRRARGPG